MRNNRGNALRLLGRRDEARREFERAIQEDSGYLPARVNLLSLLVFDIGDAKAARAHASDFLRRFPSAPEAGQVRALLDSLEARSGR